MILEIEKRVDTPAEKLVEWLEEAGEEMDSGNRLAGQNLWFAVTRETLIKIAKIEQRINELEMKVRELEERLEDLEEGRS